MQIEDTIQLNFGRLHAAFLLCAFWDFYPHLVKFSTDRPCRSETGSKETTPPITLRATSKLVFVDVVVLDKKKQPVHGLKPEDFSLTENRAPQHFLNFEEHAAPSEAELAKVQPSPKLAPGSFSNFSATPFDSPMNVLLLDRLNTPSQDQKQMEKQIRVFLASARPGQRMAIFGLTDHLQLLQGFTDDPEILRAAVSNTKGLSGSPFLGTPGLAMFVGGSLTGDNADSAKGLTANTVSDQTGGPDSQQMPAFQLEVRAKYTMQALAGLARYLAILPGRKNLIWFSGSFPVNIMPDMSQQGLTPAGVASTATPFRNTASYEKGFLGTTALLSRSQVAVYPIDVGGLTTSSNYTAEDNGCSGCSKKSGTAAHKGITASLTDFADHNFDSNSTMEMMADDTGGKAFINTNDFTTSMTKALADGSNYYTITYRPSDSNWNGNFREVQVKLKDHGYTLSYRRGYFAKNLEDLDGSPTSQGPSPMRIALAHGAPEPTQLGFIARVLPTSTATQNDVAPHNQTSAGTTGPYRQYRVDYAIDPRQIHFLKGPDGNRHETLEFVTLVYNADGTVVNSLDNSMKAVVTPAQYEQFLKVGLPFRQDVSVPAKGSYTFRIAVHDVEVNLVGAVEIPVAFVAGLPPLEAAK